MAMLKDSVVSGSLRVTDKAYTDGMQARIVTAPTTSGGSTYGPGSNGQVLRSNGTTSYWSTLDASAVGAVASNQGTGNAGKWLIVNSSGVVTPTSITTRSSSDLTASGATVTAPAGYYSAAATKTIGNGTVVASVSSNSGGSASMAATGFTASSSATSYYVTLSTSAGSVKAKAVGGTAGYVTSSTTNETAATSVAVSGNGNKLYIPAGSVTASVSSNSGGSASMAATGFTASSSATSYYVTLSTSAGSVKAKATGGTAGYVTSSTTNETGATSVAVSGNGNKLYVPAGGYSGSVSAHSISTTPVVTGSLSGTGTNIGTTTKPSGTDGTDYWAFTPGGSVTTTGVSSAKGKATISTAGYIPTGNNESANHTVNITPTVSNGTTRYLTKATTSVSNGTATATNGTASTSVTGMVTTSTNTGYSVSASATGGNASVTASSATVNAGYNPSAVTASTTAKSATGTSASDTKYIQKGALSASVSSNSGGSASMAATGFTASSSATSYYVTLSTSAGSVKAKASVGTEGYVKSETNETGATSVAVSGNGNKLYIPAATPAFTGGGVSGSSDATFSNITTSSTDNGIKIQTRYSASRTAVTYNGAVAGYVSISSGTSASAAASVSNQNGTAYYVTGITVPKDKTFSVTTTADTALDTTSDISITNNAYRRVVVDNKGTTRAVTNTNGTGFISIGAFADSSATALSSFEVVSSGRWNQAGITIAGGGLSNTTNYSGTPTVSLSLDSQSTSGIGITDTAQSSGYYVKLTGSTAKLTGSTTVTRAAVTDTRTEGHLFARSSTTIISSGTSSPSVTVNAASKTRYLTLPTATFAISGASVYCSAGGWVPTGSTSSVLKTISSATPAFTGGGVSGSSDATFSNVTTSSTDNGIKIQTRYSASRTAVTYNGAVAGYVSVSSGTTASAAASVSNQNGTAYYVTGVTVPANKSFSVSNKGTLNITGVTGSAINVTSGRTLTISHDSTCDVTHSGDSAATHVTSIYNDYVDISDTGGTVVNAKIGSGSNTYEAQVVTGGRWIDRTITGAGTYYGRVTVNGGTISNPQITIDLDGDPSTAVVNARTDFTSGFISQSSYVADGIFIPKYGGQLIKPSTTSNTVLTRGSIIGGDITIAKLEPTNAEIEQFTQDSTASKSASKVYYGRLTIRARLTPNHVYIVYGIGISSGFMTNGLPMLYGPLPTTVTADSGGYIALSGCYFQSSGGSLGTGTFRLYVQEI